MNSILILVTLILFSAIPALAIYFWFHAARYPISLIKFLLILLTGAAVYFPALLMQSFFPDNFIVPGRIGIIINMFLPIAFTEELSRLIVLLIFFAITHFIIKKKNTGKIIAETNLPAENIPGDNTPARNIPVDNTFAATDKPRLSYSEVIYGTAVGLVAGFGFAILENAAYGTVHTNVILLRLLAAAPLHGACGARIGSAAVLFPKHPLQALLRFLTAIVIHGIYNSMIVIPGIASIAAVFIALFSLASVIVSIHNGMKRKTA